MKSGLEWYVIGYLEGNGIAELNLPEFSAKTKKMNAIFKLPETEEIKSMIIWHDRFFVAWTHSIWEIYQDTTDNKMMRSKRLHFEEIPTEIEK